VAWAKRLFRSFALDLALAEPEHRPILLRALMRHRGIPRELEEAMAWVREIETSDARTLYEMALKLKAGLDGLPPHEQRARDWMSDAAMKGLVEARYTLAMWLLEEPRDERDIENALWWLYDLGARGHRRALEKYGRRLAEGRDVVQNDRDAYIVLMRAKAAGAEVEDILGDLRRRLPAPQLAEAEILLEGRSFLPLAQVLRSSGDVRDPEPSPESVYQEALSLLRAPHSCLDVDRALVSLYNLSQDGYLPALLEYARQLAEGTCIARDELSVYTVLLLAERAGAEVAELEERLASRLTPAQQQEAQSRADLRLVPFYRMKED
jgi:TPR repeat protein